MINTINQYANITTQTTTQVFTGACTLVSIVVNTSAAGTIKLIDGTSGVTANIGTITCGNAELGVTNYDYNISLANGIRIVTSVAMDITVVYRSH
jgi:hypothetical protein